LQNKPPIKFKTTGIRGEQPARSLAYFIDKKYQNPSNMPIEVSSSVKYQYSPYTEHGEILLFK
jgi:hypothetical protein